MRGQATDFTGSQFVSYLTVSSWTTVLSATVRYQTYRLLSVFNATGSVCGGRRLPHSLQRNNS